MGVGFYFKILNTFLTSNSFLELPKNTVYESTGSPVAGK
jgi:hypothetical protein